MSNVPYREVVVDTETTGFDVRTGDRLTEIGAVELINGLPSGKTYQQYINPERDVPQASVNVTGLTGEFLADFPTFAEIAADFLEFIGDSQLVMHNAKFDMSFLNYQLQDIGFPELRNTYLDTLSVARKKFPGAPATLDALSKRFTITIERDLHGALLDSQILAEVLIELRGGRQQGFDLADADTTKPYLHAPTTQVNHQLTKTSRAPRHFEISVEELHAHQEMTGKMKNSRWRG